MPAVSTSAVALAVIWSPWPDEGRRGWSTNQTWTGVRLGDLARLNGAGEAAWVEVESLEREGG